MKDMTMITVDGPFRAGQSALGHALAMALPGYAFWIDAGARTA